MAHITLRKIPDSLLEHLKTYAKEHRQSINSAAISLLSKQLGLTPQKRHKRRDLSRMAGLWTEKDADEFAVNTAILGRVDESMWQ